MAIFYIPNSTRDSWMPNTVIGQKTIETVEETEFNNMSAEDLSNLYTSGVRMITILDGTEEINVPTE